MLLAAVIYAKNLDRLVAFYGALGLNMDEGKLGDYAVLTGPETEISVVQIPDHVASRVDLSEPSQARENTPIKLVFFVESIEETLAATLVLGGRLQDGSKRWHFRGHAIQDAVDPEGNIYQLREAL
jgi:predicted enzyme related to lactoylglutathione lyase